MSSSIPNTDINALLTSLMVDYESMIPQSFDIEDVEGIMKPNLMHVMQQYKMKPRGNISRLVVAVSQILNVSGFDLDILDPYRDVFPNYSFQPSDLCYTFNCTKLEGEVTVKFSFDENNVNLVSVSGIYIPSPNSEVEKVHTIVIDLMKYATALIECLHGAVSDSSEMKILELWWQVYKDICFPLQIGLRLHQVVKSERYKEYLRVRDEFVTSVVAD